VSIWHAIILGIVQGLTEFLPISSSAHLIIVPWLFGWKESGLQFDVALHMGTLVAVLIYFWRDLLDMGLAVPQGIRSRRPFEDPKSRLAWIIVVGTIPAAIVGGLFNDRIDNYFHQDTGGNRAIALVALLMIGLALILLIAERTARHTRPMEDLGWKSGLFIGCAQALALLPGVSRSGSTITAGLMTGLKRDSAARFSFLLGVPAILGAGVLETKKVMDAGLSGNQLTTFIVGAVTSAIIGYLAIAFLLAFLRSNSTFVFIVYRVIFGVMILSLVLAGFRT
jgi:undecaprenyl-diphosphatase